MNEQSLIEERARRDALIQALQAAADRVSGLEQPALSAETINPLDAHINVRRVPVKLEALHENGFVPGSLAYHFVASAAQGDVHVTMSLSQIEEALDALRALSSEETCVQWNIAQLELAQAVTDIVRSGAGVGMVSETVGHLQHGHLPEGRIRRRFFPELENNAA